MQINITARHFDLTDGIKEHIHNEFDKLDRYIDNVIQAHIVLDVEKYRNLCEVSLKYKGQDVFVKAESNDMYASVSKAIEKMERSLKKLKEKITEHKKKSDEIPENDYEQEFIEAAQEKGFSEEDED